MTEVPNARATAVAVLNAVLDEGQILSQVLADLKGPLASLPPQERARAQRLALTVLRHLEPADKVLSAHMRRSPPAFVHNVLRLAVVELAVDGAASHGVVNAAVNIVRHNRKTTHQAGFTNAILRKVADTPAPFAALPPQRMPMWLRKPLVAQYGREVVTAIETVHAMTPPVDLTAKSGATLPEGEVLPTGSLRVAPAQVSQLAGYDAGDWWVQDAAAAIAVRLLDPQAGETIADLCAAPGGKTLQLAAAGADVTAVDISGPRLARLAENLARTGLTAKVETADVLHWTGGPFDAILLDAPCSATGTIRRHPDLPFIKSEEDIAPLADLQAQMIDHALTLLKPGGRLVFCTCSLLRAEGEDQLAAALARHPDLRADTPCPQGIDPAWIVDSGLRLRPDYWADRGGMDGFFMARLVRGA